jgi:hypothetical protein
MPWFSLNPKEEQNPLLAPWQRRKDRAHELRLLRGLTDWTIMETCRSVHGFKSLEAIYSFYISREHPDTLELAFGNRPMFRLKVDQKSLAVENGPTLLYSMGPDGTISTILYPVKSDLASVNEDHLFLGIGATSGCKLIEGMRNDVRDLVAYAHVSSIDMDATWGERLRIGALRIMRPRAQKGTFEQAPIWSAFMGITNFATRAAASTGLLAIFKPVGLGAALLLIGWLGWETLADILRSMISAK